MLSREACQYLGRFVLIFFAVEDGTTAICLSTSSSKIQKFIEIHLFYTVFKHLYIFMFPFFYTIFDIIWKQLTHNVAVVCCFPAKEARLKYRGRRCSPQALAIRRPLGSSVFKIPALILGQILPDRLRQPCAHPPAVHSDGRNEP